MVDAPPPRSSTVLSSAMPVVNLSTRSVWNRCFVCPTVLSQMLFPWNLLAWLTVQVPFSLKFSPLKSQIAGSTGHPDQCALCGALWSAATAPATRCTGCQLHQPKPLPGILHLFYPWEFPRSVGNKDPSGNAALTHPPRIRQELQSWVVLTTPS